MRFLLGCLVVTGLGACAHETEPPPKILRWSDTALGNKPSAGSSDAARDAPAAASPDASLAAVRTHFPEVKVCYERGLKKSPKLAGKLLVRIAIDKDGKVVKATTTETSLGDPSVERCVKDLILSWRLPTPANGPTEFVYPFQFETEGATVKTAVAAGATEAAPEEPAEAEGDELTVKSAKDLQSCYDRFGKGAKGAAVLSFSVAPPSKVIESKVLSSTIKKPKFDACLAAAVKAWPFPTVKEKTPVKLPLVFDGKTAAINAGEEGGGGEAGAEAGGGEEGGEVNLPDDVAKKLEAVLKARLAALSCSDATGKLRGQLGLGIRITKEGRIKEAVITQSSFHEKPGAAAVEQCIVDAAKGWKLVALPQQLDIEIPVVFPPTK